MSTLRSALCPVHNHTTDSDKTRQPCFIRVGCVNRIGDKSRLSATEIFENQHEVVFLSQFCPVSKCDVNTICFQTRSHCRHDWTKLFRGLLKTIGNCHQLCSHHRQDKCQRCDCSCVYRTGRVAVINDTSQHCIQTRRPSYYVRVLSLSPQPTVERTMQVVSVTIVPDG